MGKKITEMLRETFKKLRVALWVFVLIFSSCKEKKKEIINGGWIIDKILINGENRMDTLLSNAIFFRSDHSCSFPSTRLGEIQVGHWEISGSNHLKYVLIETENVFFNKKFKIHVDTTDKIGLKLSSENLTLECSKLFNW
jgi:hypothetical protein